MEFHHIHPLLEAEGSRTITAGSDLHRPRYTRELSTRRAHSTPTVSIRRQSGRGHDWITASRRGGRRRHGRPPLPRCRRCRSRPRGSCPRVHSSQRSRRIKIMSESPRICTSTSSAFRPASRRTASRQRLRRLCGHQQLISPVPVVTVVMREQGEPDCHRSTSMPATWTRTPDCPWTSTSLRPGRPCRCAGRPAQTAGRWPLALRADISWCGKIRSLPPA